MVRFLECMQILLKAAVRMQRGLLSLLFQRRTTLLGSCQMAFAAVSSSIEGWVVSSVDWHSVLSGDCVPLFSFGAEDGVQPRMVCSKAKQTKISKNFFVKMKSRSFDSLDMILYGGLRTIFLHHDVKNTGLFLFFLFVDHLDVSV